MKTTIRQTLAMMREEKLYSAMYIAGTALAIAFVMLIAEVYYVKMADIAPEVNRSKTYYLDAWGVKSDADVGVAITYHDYRNLFQKMQTPTCMASTMIALWDYNKKINLKMPDGIHDKTVKPKMTDDRFFTMYQFRFLEGAPFSQDDFENGRQLVVITDELAEQLYGKGVKAVGQTLRICHADYRVCGVVEKPSALTEICAADIWAPYTAEGMSEELGDVHFDRMPLALMFCVPNSKREDFMKELKEVEARCNAVRKEDQVDVMVHFISHYDYVWKGISSAFVMGNGSLFWFLMPAILLLLLVPALNLSGMVASRMERRLSEMAIRKAFGAKRRTLLGQVITENLILTLMGGALGLCLAWTALYAWRDWVFYVFSANLNLYDCVPIIRGEMLFGPLIFLLSLVVCGLLNVLAATLPAWISLKKPIVESMNVKK